MLPQSFKDEEGRQTILWDEVCAVLFLLLLVLERAIKRGENIELLPGGIDETSPILGHQVSFL